MIADRHLRAQLERVQAKGYWPHLQAAIQKYFPAGPFDVADLFAIGSRETGWDPRWETQPGDGGNGFGPLQIDGRYYPEWVATGAWRDVPQAIMKGAAVLRMKYEEICGLQGKRFPATTRSGQTYWCPKGKALSVDELRAVVIAAYNCGRWSMYHVSKGRDPDFGTTGHDYSKDVLSRAARVREWRGNDSGRICPTCGQPIAGSR